jgi:hypothetical protein
LSDNPARFDEAAPGVAFFNDRELKEDDVP